MSEGMHGGYLSPRRKVKVNNDGDSSPPSKAELARLQSRKIRDEWLCVENEVIVITVSHFAIDRTRACAVAPANSYSDHYQSLVPLEPLVALTFEPLVLRFHLPQVLEDFALLVAAGVDALHLFDRG